MIFIITGINLAYFTFCTLYILKEIKIYNCQGPLYSENVDIFQISNGICFVCFGCSSENITASCWQEWMTTYAAVSSFEKSPGKYFIGQPQDNSLSIQISLTVWSLFMRCVSCTFTWLLPKWTPTETFEAFSAKLLSDYDSVIYLR